MLVWRRGGGGLRGWWRRGGTGRGFGVSLWRFGLSIVGDRVRMLLVIGGRVLLLIAGRVLLLLAEDGLELLVTRILHNSRLLWRKKQGGGFYISRLSRLSRLLLPPLTTSPRPCHCTTSDVVSFSFCPHPFFLAPSSHKEFPTSINVMCVLACATLHHLVAPSWPLQYSPAN